MSIATLTLDAPRAKRALDPTNTIRLRQAFRAAAQLRLRQLRAAMRIAVVDHDVLALGGGEALMAYHPADVRLRAFNAWLDSTGRAYFMAHDWLRSWVEKAWASGVRAAAAEVDLPPAPLPRDHEHLVQLARIEVDGILAAIVQNVSRQAELLIARPGMRRYRAFLRLGTVLDLIGKPRMSALADTITVKAHNQAKLEVYRAIGVGRVGITPELEADALTRDRVPAPSRYRLRQFKRAVAGRAKLRTRWAEKRIGVRTAGDNRVCQRCEDYAEGAPYGIDDVLDQLPMHPRCRCAVFPWDDRRFKRDAFE